jgi:hypothetical protein
MSWDEDLRIHQICKKWRAHVKEYGSWLRRKEDSAPRREQFCKERGLDVSAFCWWVEYVGREDEYTYYASLASEYLENAKRTLDLLERYCDIDSDLRMPLMRDAIVSYGALFHRSCRRVSGSFTLDVTLVPDALRSTHDRVYELRDVIVAHCDLRPRDPHVAPFGIILRGAGFYEQDYLQLRASFKDLVDTVLANLEDYRERAGLTTPEVAFQNIGDPPPAALEDPGVNSAKGPASTTEGPRGLRGVGGLRGVAS